MKKKLAAIVCAAALCLAMPGMAFAANSPVSKNATQGSTTAAITSEEADSSLLVITGNTDMPSIPSGQTAVCSYYVNYEDGQDGATFPGGTLTINVGTAYAGQTATIIVVHNSGETETFTQTVSANGQVTVEITKLSTYTVTVATSNNGSGSSTKTNTSSTSPTTGVDLTGAAGASAFAVIAGAGITVALRKKVNE